MVFLPEFESEEYLAIPVITAAALLFYDTNLMLLVFLTAVYLSSIVLLNLAEDISDEFEEDENSDNSPRYIIGSIILLRLFNSDLVEDERMDVILVLITVGTVLLILSNIAIFVYAVIFLFTNTVPRTSLSFFLVLSTIFQSYIGVSLLISSIVGIYRGIKDSEFRQNQEEIWNLQKS